MKLSRGWTKGGPSSMDGCFCVYVVKTTNALLLFFKHRNLEVRTQVLDRREGLVSRLPCALQDGRPHRT